MTLLTCSPAADEPLTQGALPAHASSPIAMSPDGRLVWTVNPDADSISALDAQTLRVTRHIAVGREPWSLAVTPNGEVVVANRAGHSLSIVRNRHVVAEIDVGPEPAGVVLSSDGRLAYVTISSNDEVAIVDLNREEVRQRIATGRLPWAIARIDTAGEPDRFVITHRLARRRPDANLAANDGKNGHLMTLDGATYEIAPYDFGFANALESLAVSDGTLFAPHILNAPELPRAFNQNVSAALTSIDLDSGSTTELHLNDPLFSTPVNFPRAIALGPGVAYIVLSGSDAVMGVNIEDREHPRLIGFWPTGNNPRGITVDADGRRAYVMNYLSRDVSVLDLEDVRRRPELARVRVAPETLEARVLRGKVLFSNASDPRLSSTGWMSCESCHFDGGVDGTTWVTADGLRQTMPLWNLGGTAPFHASATRDELQDVEHDIRHLMRGVGLAQGAPHPKLGPPNAGRSADLDALAEFLLHGIRAPAGPRGDVDARARGRALFARNGCTTCHAGPSWTRSSLPGPPGEHEPGLRSLAAALHDVGTFNAEFDVLGADGFDIPALVSLHATPPYLHDGSATTLKVVLQNTRHAGALSDTERAELAAFLESIDATTTTFD